jgi:DNA-binding transcriptional LysR family regulator
VKLDLNGLEALEAVVRYGGFARAAKHLHRGQPAVSHQVRKIEQQLGVSLFNRDRYRVQLTPAGEAILAEGRRLLAQAEHVRSIARQCSEDWEPSLSAARPDSRRDEVACGCAGAHPNAGQGGIPARGAVKV